MPGKKRKERKEKKKPSEYLSPMTTFEINAQKKISELTHENQNLRKEIDELKNVIRALSKKNADLMHLQTEQNKNNVPPDDSSDEGGKKKPKKTAVKDPNKPKRNMSAFHLYSVAHRAEVKGQNPSASFGDITKIISEQFKSLPEKEKSKWEEEAAKDKIRYQEEMKGYNAN